MADRGELTEQPDSVLMQAMLAAIDEALAQLVEPETLRVVRAGAAAGRQWLDEHNRSRAAFAARASAAAQAYPYVPVIRLAMRYDR